MWWRNVLWSEIQTFFNDFRAVSCNPMFLSSKIRNSPLAPQISRTVNSLQKKIHAGGVQTKGVSRLLWMHHPCGSWLNVLQDTPQPRKSRSCEHSMKHEIPICQIAWVRDHRVHGARMNVTLELTHLAMKSRKERGDGEWVYSLGLSWLTDEKEDRKTTGYWRQDT